MGAESQHSQCQLLTTSLTPVLEVGQCWWREQRPHHCWVLCSITNLNWLKHHQKKKNEEKPFESKLRSKTKIHRNGRSHLVSATKQPQKSAKINEKKTKTHSSRFTFNSTETQHWTQLQNRWFRLWCLIWEISQIEFTILVLNLYRCWLSKMTTVWPFCTKLYSSQTLQGLSQ